MSDEQRREAGCPARQAVLLRRRQATLARDAWPDNQQSNTRQLPTPNSHFRVSVKAESGVGGWELEVGGWELKGTEGTALPPSSRLLEHRDVRQLAIALLEVEAVADDEAVFDGESDILHADVDDAA